MIKLTLNPCINCGHTAFDHSKDGTCWVDGCDCPGFEADPEFLAEKADDNAVMERLMGDV